MFFYTHLNTNGFAVSAAHTWSNTVDPITDPNTANNIPGFSGSYSALSRTSVYLSAGKFVSDIENISTDGAADHLVVTSRTSYLSGTHTTSSRVFTSTRHGTMTRYNALATPSSSSINLESQDFDVGYSTIPYVGLTNGTKTHDGSSTVKSTVSFTFYGTKTNSFFTTWFTNSATTLSGSASMTESAASLTATGSLSEVTTLTWCFGQLASEQRWYNARQLPPPLRRCAGLLQVLSISDGLNSFETVLPGEVTTASTALSASSYSRTSTEQDIFAGDSAGGGETINQTFLTSVHGFRVAEFSTSNIALSVSAQRSSLAGACFDLSGFSSGGSAYSLNPTISDSSDLFIMFGQSASLPLVFTSRKTGKTVNGSSAVFQWTHTNGSWRLCATLLNNSTSITTEISIQTIGTLPTAICDASAAVGCSTGILGPLYGLPSLGLDQVSITLKNDRTDGVDGHFGFSGNSFTQTGTSPVYSISFSSSQSQTAAFSYDAGLVTGTRRSFFARQYGYSISSMTYLWPASTAESVSAATSISANGAYSKAKWNEAGRLDAVSVDQ